jgi:hypothetical protein
MKRSVIRGLHAAKPGFRCASSRLRNFAAWREIFLTKEKALEQGLLSGISFVSLCVIRAIHALTPSGPALQRFTKLHGAVLNSVAGLRQQVRPRDGAHKSVPDGFVVRDIFYSIASNSTSNTSVAPGCMCGGAPWLP